MSSATGRSFDELELLSTCALRIDGYGWAVDSGIERHQLMRAFWHDDAWDELFAESWDYQWAAWFMQERSCEWSRTAPSPEIVARWRQLFLVLAPKRPSPPFDRGGPDASGAAVKQWERRYQPFLTGLHGAVAERLARGVPVGETLTV